MAFRAISWMTAGLLCVLLGGCFKSETPLVDQSNAAWPFKRAKAVLYDKGERMAYNLERTPAAYAFTDLPPDEKAMSKAQVLFYRVNENQFIMQSREEEKPEADLFVFRLDGNKFTVSTCDSYKEETLALAGIKKNYASCKITDLGQLARLAAYPPDANPGTPGPGDILLMEK